jgi:hypothetical protein
MRRSNRSSLKGAVHVVALWRGLDRCRKLHALPEERRTRPRISERVEYGRSRARLRLQLSARIGVRGDAGGREPQAGDMECTRIASSPLLRGPADAPGTCRCLLRGLVEVVQERFYLPPAMMAPRPWRFETASRLSHASSEVSFAWHWAHMANVVARPNSQKALDRSTRHMTGRWLTKLGVVSRELCPEITQQPSVAVPVSERLQPVA